jgi:hypothetical protein
MTGLKKSLIALVSAACCSIAAADTIYDSVSLSTSYTMSITGWWEMDQEAIYVPAHSILTVTDYSHQSDTMEYMYLQEEGGLYSYWPNYLEVDETFINDSEEGVYYYVELLSSVYTDSYDLIHCPASSASVSYRIDSIEDPLP